jgi:hypothetical protein
MTAASRSANVASTSARNASTVSGRLCRLSGDESITAAEANCRVARGYMPNTYLNPPVKIASEPPPDRTVVGVDA